MMKTNRINFEAVFFCKINKIQIFFFRIEIDAEVGTDYSFTATIDDISSSLIEDKLVINEGYVYIAESPLYEINTKDRTYFAYTEPEKARILNEISNQKYTIQRSKGLGENEPDMMSLTTMNPETRRLIKVLPTDVEATQEMFEMLLGNNLEGRKEYIRENGSQYLDDLDLS